jgi:hypothetical protein
MLDEVYVKVPVKKTQVDDFVTAVRVLITVSAARTVNFDK